MLTRKFTVVMITALMLCVSFSIVSTDDAEGLEFVSDFTPAVPISDGTFVANDIVWNTAGSLAVAVGSGSLGNVWVYRTWDEAWLGPMAGMDTTQVFQGVCYDDPNGLFWWCGDFGSTGPSSVYYWGPGGPLDASYPVNGTPLTTTVYDIATDIVGNPLAVGFEVAYYHDGSDWVMLTGTGVQELYLAVDYNTHDDRFYFGGYYQMSKGATYDGRFYYTDPYPHSSCYLDTGYNGHAQGPVYDIAWNQGYNYGLVIGETVNTVTSAHIWTEIKGLEMIETMFTQYNGASWDTSSWTEAAIVGSQWQMGLGARGTYWRYYNSGTEIIPGHVDETEMAYNCVGFKPPASPKWVLIPLAGGGGVVINVFMEDQSTVIRVNSAFPHIFMIDMWEMTDPGRNSVLNTEVDVGSTYTFYLRGNYTIGGEDNWWNTAEIELLAWFDGGLLAGASVPPGMADDTRTRQFWTMINPGTNASAFYFPTLFPNEFSLDSFWADPAVYGAPLWDYWHDVYINVTFEVQTYAADGQTFINGPAVPFTDINFALNDQFSWDFNYTIYDSLFPSAESEAWEEFGVKEAVAIIASGNPSGNAPPGSSDVQLGPQSNITYFANTPYWVNVSIPNLLLGGVGPQFIQATDIAIRNDHMNASYSNSDIGQTPPAGRAFTGAGAEWCVWGNRTLNAPMPTPLNGTIAGGEWGSDFSALNVPNVDYTLVSWWATVGLVPEGVYWATITFTIYDT